MVVLSVSYDANSSNRPIRHLRNTSILRSTLLIQQVVGMPNMFLYYCFFPRKIVYEFSAKYKPSASKSRIFLSIERLKVRDNYETWKVNVYGASILRT